MSLNPSNLDHNIVTNPERLNDAMAHKFDSYINLSATIELPCLPSMLDYYLEKIETLVKVLGKNKHQDQLDFIRFIIEDHLDQGFNQAPDTCLKIILNATGEDGLKVKFETNSQTLNQRYQEWIDYREPPLFGEYPDAKVMDTVAHFFSDRHCQILDIGAGNGRNTIPLARQGYNVDAVELTSVFCQQLTELVKAENLSVQVIQTDMINPDFPFNFNYYHFVFASEVISTHIRTINDLRNLLTVINNLLQEGGLFLFDTFMPLGDYIPDQKAREMGQLNWTCILTNEELNDILGEFSLEIVSNESQLKYEKTHQNPDAFPRNSWFTSWSQGRNIFPLLDQEKPPLELRWILCRKK